MSYTVTNAGAGATPNFTWNDALYLSPTATFNARHGHRPRHPNAPGQPGCRWLVTPTPSPSRLPNGLTGTYYLLVDTDARQCRLRAEQGQQLGRIAAAPSRSPRRRADLVVTAVSAPTGGPARLRGPGHLDGHQPGRRRYGRQLLAGRGLRGHRHHAQQQRDPAGHVHALWRAGAGPLVYPVADGDGAHQTCSAPTTFSSSPTPRAAVYQPNQNNTSGPADEQS